MTSTNPDLSIPTCRACLQNSNDHEMLSIFDIDKDLDDIFIYQELEECGGIKVLSEENLPTFICVNCYGLLRVAYQFRITCRSSEQYLKTILGMNIKTEYLLEQNPLSIKEDTSDEKDTRSEVRICLTNVSSPIPEFIKNEIAISADSPTNFEEHIADIFEDCHSEDCSKKILPISIKAEHLVQQNPLSIKEGISEENGTCSEASKCLTDVSGPITESTKKETTISADIPTNFEEHISNIFQDCDDNGCFRSLVMCFDTNYDNDENAIHGDKNTKVSVQEINLDAKEEKLKTSFGDDEDKIMDAKTPHPENGKEENRPHICETCGKSFQYRYSFRRHIKRHLNEKPYKCEICGYSCYRNIDLVRHFRKHTGSKPYKCKYCDQAFGDQSTLVKHERVHRNERPFKCDICDASFSYPDVLRCHKRIHTGEKPYKCEMCGKCVTSRQQLRKHLKTLQHQNDPRLETLLRNIRINNEIEMST